MISLAKAVGLFVAATVVLSASVLLTQDKAWNSKIYIIHDNATLEYDVNPDYEITVWALNGSILKITEQAGDISKGRFTIHYQGGVVTFYVSPKYDMYVYVENGTIRIERHSISKASGRFGEGEGRW